MGNAFLSAGEADSAVHYLALSSVSDLKSAVKEYISLWQLAGLLYERGDVDRAYRYVQTSLDDATAGNARLRTIGISRIYPLIEGAYRSKIAGQQQQLRRFLLAIALLALVLVVAVVLVGVQLKRLRRARKALSVLNGELERTNRELRESNRQLQEMNRLISDSEKIAHFLRYSVSTIYNYRTRTRNKAAGDRGLLEAEVLKIGLDKA